MTLTYGSYLQIDDLLNLQQARDRAAQRLQEGLKDKAGEFLERLMPGTADTAAGGDAKGGLEKLRDLLKKKKK